jgi:hypothetical protein
MAMYLVYLTHFSLVTIPDTRPTFRENRGQFHKQNNTNNMEYYNIRNRDMGRNDVWDMSRDDVWDMSSDDV